MVAVGLMGPSAGQVILDFLVDDVAWRCLLSLLALRDTIHALPEVLN